MSLQIVTKERELIQTERKDYNDLRGIADRAYGQFEVVCDALNAEWKRKKECGEPSIVEAARTLEELFDKAMDTFYELRQAIENLPKVECTKCGKLVSWNKVTLRHGAGEDDVCRDCAHSKNTPIPSV